MTEKVRDLMAELEASLAKPKAKLSEREQTAKSESALADNTPAQPTDPIVADRPRRG